MITASKALAQDISANTKGGCNKIPSMYKRMLFAVNSEYIETPAKKNLYPRNINIQYKDQYQSPQSLGSGTETPRTILCIFTDCQFKKYIMRSMVVSI